MQRSDRVLTKHDPLIAEELRKYLEEEGIKIYTGVKTKEIKKTEAGIEIEVDIKDKGLMNITAEKLFLGAGLSPHTKEINADKAEVELNERGFVKVNEYMQTSVPNVYAIGDVVTTPWLAHVASAEGILAVEHLVGRDVQPINYDQVPGVTFCQPEVGSVGLTEATARDRGYDVGTGKFPFSALAKAAIEGNTAGFVKVVREKKYDELLGVHVIGAHATDLISEACVALRLESTTEELFRAIHAHPTMAEAVAEAAHAAVDRAIHI